MIDLSVMIEPFSYQNECGDFYIYKEFKDYCLIVLGDIGGHGSSRVFEISEEIKSLILKNHDLSIDLILQIVHSQKSVQQTGAVIFIAKIFKNLQIIKYAQIGNIKAYTVRDKKLNELYFQEGILGINIPQNIKINISKIKKDDIFIIFTDGVSFLKSTLNKLSSFTDSKSIIGFCKTNLIKNSDDAMCLVFRYEYDNVSFSLPVGDSLSKKQEKQTVIFNKAKEKKIKKIDFSFKSEPLQYLELDTSYHFVTLNRPQTVKNDIYKILEFCKIPKSLISKIITFAVEAVDLNDTQNKIEVFLSKRKLQFLIAADKKYVNGVKYLFEKYSIQSFDDKNASITLEFLLPKDFILEDEAFDDLQNEIKLGLDGENYKKFKDNNKNQMLLFEQSKLTSMGKMIENIAHQWRQPLSLISTVSTGMKLKLEYDMEISKEEIEQSFENINETVQYLSKTIDDFRSFINSDNSKQMYYRLFDILEKTISLIKPSYEDRYIKLIRNTSEDVVLYGYPNEMIQALVNILTNSKDSIARTKSPDKYVFLNTYITNGKICIDIQDCGGGIPKNIIDKIFEPYFTTKHESQGTGIGLYMARQIIVEHNGGDIVVSNQKVNYKGFECEGANCKIHLPIAKNTEVSGGSFEK